MAFKYYIQPFDITKFPPGPPLVTIREGGFFGGGETKESKRRAREWKLRMEEYRNNVLNARISALDRKVTELEKRMN